MDIDNKTVIITGAGSGIGAALAQKIAQLNPRHMLLLDINLTGLKQTAAGLKECSIDIAHCDVSNAGEINAHVLAVVKRFSAIDLFCSNAGVFVAGGADVTAFLWQHSFAVNCMAHVHAANSCLPHMLKQQRGYFLQTISAAALLAQIGSAPYSASKHAALGFAQWLAITYGKRGIGVTALCPEGVNTPMLADITNPETVINDGLLSPETVAECGLNAVAKEQFLALPHPEVQRYVERKASDNNRWIKNMQKYVD